MVGTSLDGQGGVATVLRTWQQSGLMDRWNVTYVPTNGAGGPARKALLAARAWWKCARLIVFRKVNLVHVHTSSYSSFWRKSPIFAMAIAAGLPLVVSLHGGGFRDFYATRSGAGKAWIRLVMRRAKRFIVLTHSWRRWAEDIEPRSRVSVIPNPAPRLPELSSLGTGDTWTTLKPLAVCATSPVLLFLGRIEREKGIYVLIEAVALAKRMGVSCELVCGGSGEIEAARQRASELGLVESDVRFLGWIDGEAKHAWLCRCDMLVLPSLMENMPVVLLESFAYGKPVLASSVGGIPDMVHHGVDGFLCPPNDPEALSSALCMALHPDTDRIAMGLAARRKVEAIYSANRVTQQIELTYQELLPT